MEKKEPRKDSHRRVLHDGEYERAPGKYIYRWREVKGYTAKGQKLYTQHSISADSLEELRDQEQQIKNDKNAGIKVKRPETLNDYVDRSLKQRRGLKPNTKSNYAYMYTKFVRNTKLGRSKVQDLKKADIIDFYSKLVDDGDMSIYTCDTLQNVIHPALTLAFEDDLVRRNVASGALKELKAEAARNQARMRALGQEPPETLTLAEQIRLLDVIKGTVWEPIITFELCTGVRIGETALTWNCVDFDEGVIYIRRTLSRYANEQRDFVTEMNDPKTAESARRIVITPKIKQMLELQKQIGYPCKVTIDGITDFIFCTREGTPHNQGSVNRYLKRMVAKANDEAGEKGVLLPSLHTHMFRKTAACNAIRRGFGIEEVAKILGHRDIQTTHRYYLVAKDMIANDKDQKLIEELQRRGIL
jgi:integrase